MVVHRARKPRILESVKATGTLMRARGVRANRLMYWDTKPAALFGCPSDFHTSRKRTLRLARIGVWTPLAFPQRARLVFWCSDAKEGSDGAFFSGWANPLHWADVHRQSITVAGVDKEHQLV